MVQTMAARTCSGKPGPRGLKGLWLCISFMPEAGAPEKLPFYWYVFENFFIANLYKVRINLLVHSKTARVKSTHLFC